MAPEAARALAVRVGSALGLVATLVAPAHALRVVDYNILNYPGTSATVRNPLFRTILNPVAADVLVTEEMSSASSADDFLNNVLNVMEPGQWARGPVTLGNDTNSALFYKPAKAAVLGHWAFYPNPANHLRLVHVWRVRPLGYTSGAAEIRFYSVHLKASTGSTNEAQRLAEATGMRDSMNAVPAGTHCIALGDFNFYRGTEGGMQKLIETQADNDGRLYDPLGLQAVSWQDNSSMTIFHTQSPCKSGGTACAGGASTGGVDDRFDLILPTDNFQNGTGLELIGGTYATVGNDGMHLNLNITDPPTIPEGASYADALIHASDHFPVRVDVSVPSIFAGAASLDLGTVIAGGGASYSIGNSAVAPADALTGSLSATSGFVAAVGSFEIAPGAVATPAISTTEGGPFGARAGTLVVGTDAPDSPTVDVSLSANVLDHAAASLDSESVVVSDLLEFDHASGEFTDLDVRVHNAGWDPLQAALEVAPPVLSGPDAARFSVAPLEGATLESTGKSYSVHFDESGATPDQFYTATLTISSTDQDLPGGTARPDLIVHLRGIVRSGSVVGVDPALPRFTRLLAPYPNPLAGSTTIGFDLAQRGRADIGVYDLTGRRIAALAHRDFEPGRHALRWNGRDDAGSAVAPGVYFVQMNGPRGERATARIAVVR